MPFESFNDGFGYGFLQYEDLGFYFEIGIVIYPLWYGVGADFHPSHPMHKKRHKYFSLLILQPTEFTAIVDQPKIHYLLCLFRLESFLLLLLFDIVPKMQRGSFGEVDVVLEFYGEGHENDLAQEYL